MPAAGGRTGARRRGSDLWSGAGGRCALGQGRSPTRRKDGERHDQAESAGDHQDDTDGVNGDTADARMNSERQDGTHCNQKYRCADAHNNLRDSAFRVADSPQQPCVDALIPLGDAMETHPKKHDRLRVGSEVWRKPTSSLTAHRAVSSKRVVLRVRCSRRMVREDDDWPVAQVVSELATNAVVHAGTPFVLSIAHDDSRIRVSVTDRRPLARASIRRLSNDTATGRGLRIVQTLGQAWGVDQTDAAKTVWCELARGSLSCRPLWQPLATQYCLLDALLCCAWTTAQLCCAWTTAQLCCAWRTAQLCCA